MCGFIAQLVEHRTGIHRGHRFKSHWSPEITRLLLSSCLNWKIYVYCNDHSSLHLQLQFKYELFHVYFTIIETTISTAISHQLQLLLLPFDRMQVFFKIPLGILSDHYRRQLTQVPSSTYLCREAYLRTYYNDPGPAVSRLEVYSINNLQSLGLKQHSTLTFLLFLVAYIKLWSCSCFLLPLVCTLVHWPWLMEQLRLLRYCVCLTLFNVFSSN